MVLCDRYYVKGVTIGGLTHRFISRGYRSCKTIFGIGGNKKICTKSKLQIARCNLLLQEKTDGFFMLRKIIRKGLANLSNIELNQDDFEKHILFLLHIVDEGRAKDDVRQTSNRMHVARIIPKSRREPSFGRISLSLLDQIGNYVLIYGYNKRRRTSQEMDRRNSRAADGFEETSSDVKERDIGFRNKSD